MSVNETNETNETGVGGARADMLAHMGSLQQAAYTRPIEYQEGRAHGLKAIEVKNGPLRFVSMADRALDVCQFEYRGENLTFLSKPGLNGRNQFDTNGLEAQRSIMGGLFFTCGFENICAPYVTPEGGKYPAGSFPMHGRIRTTPAEHVSSDAHWTAEGDYVLEVSGEMREAELFGENLVMRRKITSVYGQPSITVEDEVTNESFRDEPLMWMYHCNFGWPLLAEGAEVVIPSRKATPRDETTAADTTPWNEIQAPEANRPESVSLHELAADDHGHVLVALPVAGLVHADGTRPVEQARTLLRSQVVGDPSAYRAHALPVHAHQPAHRASGRVHVQKRRLLFEIARVRALASGPRHHRDGHAVISACHARRRVLQHEPGAPDVEVTPPAHA